MKLGSLFDGSGGFPLAGSLCGIEPVWAAEVEPYPIAVTRSRFPRMKHLGDVTKINGAEIEPVDIFTFGSPCQDFSVSGKRAGLKHKSNGDDETTRSGLFMEAIRIIKEMRGATNGVYPRFAVWENVFGAFSSNGGEDFRTVINEIVGIVEPKAEVPPMPKGGWSYADCYVGDGWSVAYRTLDAQYWGVPQRRRRIYLVADFGGECAWKILFEREGVRGYFETGRTPWKEAPGGSSDCPGAAGFDGYNGYLTDDKAATIGVNCGMSTGRNGIVLNCHGGNRIDIADDVTCTIRAEAHHPQCIMEETVALENHPADGRIKIETDGTMQTRTSRMGTGGNNVPLLLKIRSGCEGGGKGALIQENKSATLSCNNDQTLFEPCGWNGGQISPTLTKQNAGGNQRMPDKDNFTCVLQPFGICSKDSNAMKFDNPHSGVYAADTSRTIDTSGGNPACNQGGIAVVAIEGNGSRPSNRGDGYSEGDAMYTLNSVEQHAVAHSYGFYPQMKAEGITFTEDKSVTIVNGTNPGFQNGVLEPSYTVRRLTPTECARLQGFQDKWGHPDHKEDFTDEEYEFWLNVRNTYAEINGKAVRQYTRQKMLEWYNKLHTDSAEYKMWGNGIALPCALYVMQGIQAVLNGGGAG